MLLAFGLIAAFVGTAAAGEPGGWPYSGPLSDLKGGHASFTFQSNGVMACTANNTAITYTLNINYSVTGTLPAGATLVVYLSPNVGAINGNAGGDETGYINKVQANHVSIDVAGLHGSGTLSSVGLAVTSPFKVVTGGVLGVFAPDSGSEQHWSSKTNSLNCGDANAHLTLVKVVVGGAAKASDWTLSASGPVGVSGKTGDATITSAKVPAGTYSLAESGPSGYDASSWSCVGGWRVGSKVTIGEGHSATCTITNTYVPQPAHLTLVKVVEGGTALPGAWTLSATGPSTISGASGAAAVTNAEVKAGTYTLAETGGPTHYTPGAWVCGETTLEGSTVVLAENESLTCTITNTYVPQPAHLTLVKVVENAGGGTAAATAWTLSAVGPITISGKTGQAAVTSAEVPAGTYALSEGSGPANYSAGAWSCQGGTLTGSSVALAEGQSATCTIKNTYETEEVEGATATPSSSESVEGATSRPTSTPPATSTTGDGPADDGGLNVGLFLCLAVGILGMILIETERHSVRR